MERGDPQECELERELDSLYRKVAGLDQPDGDQDRPVSTAGRAAPPKTKGQRTARSGSGRKIGFRFPARFSWGIAVAVLFLGVIGLLRWQGGGGVPLPGTLSPNERGVIVLTAEEAGEHAAAPPAGETRGMIRTDPASEARPPGDRRVRYAIQVRAYPEDQKQQALAFLDELRNQAPDVSLEAVSIAGRGVWHRILLGDFATVEEAAEYRTADRVARKHPYGFIQRKYGDAPRPSPAPRSASAGSPATP